MFVSVHCQITWLYYFWCSFRRAGVCSRFVRGKRYAELFPECFCAEWFHHVIIHSWSNTFINFFPVTLAVIAQMRILFLPGLPVCGFDALFHSHPFRASGYPWKRNCNRLHSFYSMHPVHPLQRSLSTSGKISLSVSTATIWLNSLSSTRRIFTSDKLCDVASASMLSSLASQRFCNEWKSKTRILYGLTLYLQIATMHFHQLFWNGEAQSCSAEFPCGIWWSLTETFEYFINLICRNSDSGIPYSHSDLYFGSSFVFSNNWNSDCTFLCKLYRVSCEVHDYLSDACFVTDYIFGYTFADKFFHTDSFFFRLQSENSMDVVDSSYKGNGTDSSSILPDSILARSRMSLMITSRLAPLFLITCRYFSCCSFNGDFISRLVRPTMAFIGVRISWLIFARNCWRNFCVSMRLSRVMDNSSFVFLNSCMASFNSCVLSFTRTFSFSSLALASLSAASLDVLSRWKLIRKILKISCGYFCANE